MAAGHITEDMFRVLAESKMMLAEYDTSSVSFYNHCQQGHWLVRLVFNGIVSRFTSSETTKSMSLVSLKVNYEICLSEFGKRLWAWI